jgi:hypothetical protein
MGKIGMQSQRLRHLMQFLTLQNSPEKGRSKIKHLLSQKILQLVLLKLEKDLESAIDGNFDNKASRKLDAIRALLEE